jgi:hypothetical protein
MKALPVRVLSIPSLCLVAALAMGCSSTSATNEITLGSGGSDQAAGGTGGDRAGSGGTNEGSGGTAASGGESGTGGGTDAGGSSATGGRTSTGGATATGGRTGSGGRTTGTGGTTATGGRTPSAGGTTGNGGTTSGTSSAGGTTSTGGALSTVAIQLSGNKILDSAGNPIVARGPEDVVAQASQTKDIDAAAALGANAMRMLFTLDAANAMTPQGFETLLARAVSHRMLVWVSLYTWDNANKNVIADALGGGNFYSLTAPVGAACSSSTPTTCYLAVWSRQWLKDLMNKYRSHVIVDAGQEFIDVGDASSETGRAGWATAAKTNVQFFRSQGYTNPLEVMSNYEGRDLYAILEYGDAIRAVDTVTVNGEPQTMFGWQAYWGTSDKYYQTYQGALLLGQKGASITGAEAIHQFAAPAKFPIEIGVDNYSADTNQDYQAEIDQAAADGMSWLWWSWKNGTVECPASGSTCQTYVTTSANGFKGAKPLTE